MPASTQVSLSLSLSGLTGSAYQGAPLFPEVQGRESRGIHHAGTGQWPQAEDQAGPAVEADFL